MTESMGNLLARRSIFIDSNKIRKVPESLAGLRALDLFFANHNQLTQLPKAWCNKKELRISIDDNPLTEKAFYSRCNQAAQNK